MVNIKNDLQKIWAQVGFIVQLSQMVEYNLANIIASNEILSKLDNKDSVYVFEYNDLAEESNKWYKKLSKSTFGTVIKRAREVKFFTEESYKLLEDALKKRNYVMHQFYKDDLTKNILETNPMDYYDKLVEIVDVLNKVNNDLLLIFKKQKDDLKRWY